MASAHNAPMPVSHDARYASHYPQSPAQPLAIAAHGGVAMPPWDGVGEGATASIVIVPGWRNSGPGHWQSCWAERIPGAIRVQQQDWQQPRCEPWVTAVVQSIEQAQHPVIIVAHSLGCIASVHAAAQLQKQSPGQAGRIAGALLVAPADPERRALFEDFTPVPADPLPFPSIVVASSNDPYCPIRMASAYAKSWSSTLVRLPDAGHINIESGHSEWPLGWALLSALVVGVQEAPCSGEERLTEVNR